MMRLVLLFTAGDGFTYSCDRVLPFEADSAEQGLVDFEALWKESKDAPDRAFSFGNMAFFHHMFLIEPDQFDAPDILTIDEWFDRLRSNDPL